MGGGPIGSPGHRLGPLLYPELRHEGLWLQSMLCCVCGIQRAVRAECVVGDSIPCYV
jgi:hypothetical protein